MASSKNHGRNDEAVSLRLERLDQRYTPTRQRIVEILASAGRPLSMLELLERFPNLPQSSAYRNITALIDAGVVQKIAGSDDQGRFELTEELTGEHHHHLVCSNCGKVEDAPPLSRIEKAVDELVAAAKSEKGFIVQEHRFDLLGLCRSCSR